MSSNFSHFDTSVLDRLKQVLNITKDSELADFLEVKPTVIANWRSRNRINTTCIISKCELMDINWIFFGKSLVHRPGRRYPSYEEREEIIDSEIIRGEHVREDENELSAGKKSVEIENIRLRSQVEALENLIVRLKKEYKN